MLLNPLFHRRQTSVHVRNVVWKDYRLQSAGKTLLPVASALQEVSYMC